MSRPFPHAGLVASHLFRNERKYTRVKPLAAIGPKSSCCDTEGSPSKRSRRPMADPGGRATSARSGSIVDYIATELEVQHSLPLATGTRRGAVAFPPAL